MESNKKTLFFSNIVGNIMIDEENGRFNDFMTEYLKKNINNEYSMIFINAPGIGGEEYYLKNMMRCFEKAGIKLKAVLDVEPNTTREELDDFINANEKIFFFLMGGNPYSQMETIERLDLKETLKSFNGLVIGFCAGTINLSKYSIITSDEDFKNPDTYLGIGREDICIEPHYTSADNDKRNGEILEFSKKYNTKIYCVPDESIIYFENGKKTEQGKIYYIEG